MIETNISGYEIRNNKRYPIYIRPFEECKNFQKQKKKIRLLYRKISNIRNNYLHQVTTEIVKTKPSRIFMETLKVSGMIKK